MTRLVAWLRQVFCAHAFKYEEAEFEIMQTAPLWSMDRSATAVGSYVAVSRTCQKCGWHVTYKKFAEPR